MGEFSPLHCLHSGFSKTCISIFQACTHLNWNSIGTSTKLKWMDWGKILKEQSGGPATVYVWSILAFLCSKSSCTTLSKDAAGVSKPGEIWLVGIPEVHVPLHCNAYCTSKADFFISFETNCKLQSSHGFATENATSLSMGVVTCLFAKWSISGKGKIRVLH